MDEVVQIIPYYAHPHVHVVINDNTFYDEATSTPANDATMPYSTVIVTGADKGIDNTFIRLQNAKTKKALFGNGNYKKYGQSSIQADVLFNGYTDVWFMRVMPDNATYSNMIVLLKYSYGVDTDATGNSNGLLRMNVKFAVEYATTDKITEGAKTADDILEVGNSFASTVDDAEGYKTLPLFYVRSIGRGKYGNKYSIKLTRDSEAEKEYDVKMYNWSLINNDNGATVISNVFAGSMYQTTVDGGSTLISDVLDAYATGSCPVDIYVYENSIIDLYDFYQNEIVAANAEVIKNGKYDDAEIAKNAAAAAIKINEFDPVFGYVFNTKTDEIIPYYTNFTATDKPYVAPAKTVATEADLPKTTTDWATAKVGATVLVTTDAEGQLSTFTVVAIDASGNIAYDEGVKTSPDASSYNGIDISTGVGIALKGGSDGDFESIPDGKGGTRAPTDAEMKLMLAREQVQAFRGNKDRKILSPARVGLDFIFDANYNMTLPDGDDTIANMYANSSVLTDTDYKELAAVTAGATEPSITLNDVNVKAAIYDLNNFRNRNGMTIEPDLMAGCLYHMDCGVISTKTINNQSELKAIIENIAEFTGRTCSADLGYYEIYDPYTGRRIPVTVGYFIASKLIPHLIKYGMNKPFVMTNAQLTAIQKTSSMGSTGDMIRDSFKPDIDLIDWDVKEALFKSRINYYLTSEEGRVVQRACQNTRQVEASDLLEENNVRVLNTLKKQLEKSCRSYLYNWNEAETRKGFTDTQMQIYRPWIGNIVKDIQIRFEANQFEQTRMIMHCYCDVWFRGLIKRITLEIGIQRNEG